MLENGGCRSGLLLSAEGRLQTLLISSFFLLRKKRNKAFDVAAMVNRWTLESPTLTIFWASFFVSGIGGGSMNFLKSSTFIFRFGGAAWPRDEEDEGE